MSAAEDLFDMFLRTSQERSSYTRQYRFAEGRKFTFDFAWPAEQVAVEIEGGIYGRRGKLCPLCRRPEAGGHSSVTGILRDMEKYNLATVRGWRVLRFTPDEVKSGDAFAQTTEFLALVRSA